jgi:hypothetical protein
MGWRHREFFGPPVARYVGCLISVKYFVPVTLIVETYQPWNLGNCDTLLPLAFVERHDLLNSP